ncbi:hypothetical protein ACP70R_018837 [Stipagrostis hirtigluma subsp. patula]
MVRLFNGNDFPTWKIKLQNLLSFVELDYVLREAAPVAPDAGVEGYEEKICEYQFKRDEWEKSNELAKDMIKRSMNEEIRGAFHDYKGKTAKEFLELIEEKYQAYCASFLLKKLTTARIDVNGTLGNHVKYMWDIVYELKKYGVTVSDSFVEFWFMRSVEGIWF